MLSLLCTVMIGFSSTSWAIFVTCGTGPFMSMTKTAYVKIRTDSLEYPFPGFFYGMAVTVDLDNKITGEWAGGYYKPPLSLASGDIWLAGTGTSFAWRKLLGSGGLSRFTGKSCATKYVQIVP